MLRSRVFWAPAALCVLLIGCERSETKDKLPETPATQVRYVPEPVKNIELSPLENLSDSRFKAELAPELARFSPLRDGSNSERFSETASAQLKKLEEALANPSTLDGEAIGDLVDDAKFRATVLRGSDELQEAFRSGETNVRRWAPASQGQEPEFGYQGKAGFVTALKQMARGVESLHAHFKLVSVSEPEAGVITTRLLVHASSSNAERRRQQNATWRARWSETSTDTPRLIEIALLDFEEAASSPSPQFHDCTESVVSPPAEVWEQVIHGVDHWRARIDWRFGTELIGPHGLAVGDVNGDGLDDLFLCAAGGLPNRLLLQQSDGTVRDGARDWGVDFLETTSSALILDLDNDGDQDLAFTTGRYLMILENTGKQFRRILLHSSNSIARSMCAADFDLDGDLDLYVCGYTSRSGDSIGLGRPMPYHDANNGVRNYLMENKGGWKFEDATERSGLNQNNQRFSYAAGWEDFDDDGDPDLYVANDFGRNNLYRNDNGSFTDIAAEAGVEDISAGMSAAWGDYDGDGDSDLYIGNMFSSAGNRVAYQRRFRAGRSKTVRAQFQRHARGNTLFRNSGTGSFQDVTMTAKVNMGRWAWSSNFADINNDGWADLLVANGMITGSRDPGDL